MLALIFNNISNHLYFSIPNPIYYYLAEESLRITSINLNAIFFEKINLPAAVDSAVFAELSRKFFRGLMLAAM